MPVADLSQITVTLRQLLEFNLPLIEPGLAGALDVSTNPPEDVEGGQNVLNLYCYHLTVDPANTFRPRQLSQPNAVATAPLTLALNYILTAHTLTASSTFNALAEQRLLGHAMKTLHDFPVIDDSTMVGNVPVMPDEIRGRGNRFEVIMMQLSPADALNFWANEDRITVKPSGYYEVRAVEIEPDAPTRTSGIVLSVGNLVVPFGQPTLTRSASEVVFTLPLAEGGTERSVDASPARVGPVNPAAPPQPNRLRLEGSALGDGVLHLRFGPWSSRFSGLGSVPLDLGDNGPLGWTVGPSEKAIEVDIGDQIRFAPPGAALQTFDMYPGTYNAAWEVTKRKGEQSFVERSNEVAFQVAPRVASAVRDGGGQVTLTLGGTWRLTRGRPLAADPLAEPELDVLFAVDGRTYRFEGVGTTPTVGGYMIQDHAVIYQPNAEEDTSGAHSIRLEVDGVSALPFWVEVP